MGKKRRGRERLLSCESCGRTMPRDKAVEYMKKSFYGTEMRTNDDVELATMRKIYYCISCAKHRKIFEKKKEMFRRIREQRW